MDITSTSDRQMDEKRVLTKADYIPLKEVTGRVESQSGSLDERKYTVDEALREIGLGVYHLKWIPVIAMSGFTQSSMIALAPLLITSLQCQWDLNIPIQILLLFVIFFGSFPGDVLSGVLSDKYGRKLPLIVGQLLLLIFTVLSTVSFNYVFFSVCYFFIGVAIGMLMCLSVVLLSELSPPNFRSYSVTLFLLSWVLGALYSCAVTYGLLNKHGWEIVTFVVAIPHILITIVILLVDESPKYLAITGQIAGAEQVLNRMAVQNNSDFEIVGKLCMRIENNRGSLGEVIAPEYRKEFALLSLSLGFVGLIVSSSYAMTPYVMKSNHCNYFNSTDFSAEKCKIPEAMLKETAIITTSEIVMLPIFAFVNELFGRLKTLRLLSALLLLSSFLLVFCLGSAVFVSCLYVQRGAAQSLLLILLIYTPECFPTHIRGVGCGLTMLFLFLGGLISSTMVYPVGVQHGFSHLEIALTLAAFCTLVSVSFLTNETRGTDLP
ncbi:synaptic vesicle 2-related protein-like [Bolinopsis microptera]|uniref:synaptic vesicle 2-related protein-like n=1 Tax=Bolinopsis microptera TaxID=2820187 RepID=UPI0030797F6E